jgi:hypothetical protein
MYFFIKQWISDGFGLVGNVAVSPIKMFRFLKLYSKIMGFCVLNRNSETWQRLKLRHDWIYRIYTVVNLPAIQMTGIEADPGVELYAKIPVIMKELKETNLYLMQTGVSEQVRPEFYPIEGYNSYLVKYTPFLDAQFKIKHFILFVVIITISVQYRAFFNFLGTLIWK